MFQAIHKESNKLVSAFQLMKDLSWAGKERDVFTAPKHEVGNWRELREKGIKEVEVSFVSSHTREESTLVAAHFRIKTEEAEYSTISESEEHKLAKETIYQWAFDNQITLKNFDNIPLHNLGIFDIFIEKGEGHMRADVLVDFKERHPVLGRGIAFEIQISPQKEEVTAERNYDRAFQDYSIVWIWDGDLKNSSKSFFVESVHECIRKAKENIKKDMNFFLADIGQKAEIKTQEIKSEIQNSINRMKAQAYSITSEYEPKFTSQIELLKKKLTENTIYFTEELEKTQRELYQKTKNLDEELTIRLNEKIKTYTKEEIENKLKEFDINSILKEHVISFKQKVEETIKNLDIIEIYKKNLVLAFQCFKCKRWMPCEKSLMYWKDMQPYCAYCNSKHGDEKKNPFA
jgi:hypothetical protein